MIFTVLCLILITLLAIDYYIKHFGKWKDYYRLPGPTTVPVLGNLQSFYYKMDEIFDLLSDASMVHYPIYKFYLLNNRFVTLLGPDDVELILSDTKHNTKSFVYDFLHNWLGTGLLTSTGNKWQRRRKILTPSFHFNILQDFVEIFNKETTKLVEVFKKVSHKQSVDVIPFITQFTLDSINETAMGTQLDVTAQEKTNYQTAVHEMSSVIAYRMTMGVYYSQFIYSLSISSRIERKVLKVLHGFTRKVIEGKERKFINQKHGGESNGTSYSTRKKAAMLDLLIKAKLEGADIDIDGIQEEVDTFMFEGHDTTATAICYMLMLLANHPDVQNEVLHEINETIGDNLNPSYQELQELKYTERVIKESLRLYPSVPTISRELGSDVVTKSGYRLPKGVTVNIAIYDMHHNPHVYENPEKFDADRFLPENVQNRHPFAYLPFSAGPRNCIGQKFAMLELKAVLCGILRNFKLEAVDKPEDVKVAFDIILRSRTSINIKFVPRK